MMYRPRHNLMMRGPGVREEVHKVATRINARRELQVAPARSYRVLLCGAYGTPYRSA